MKTQLLLALIFSALSTIAFSQEKNYSRSISLDFQPLLAMKYKTEFGLEFAFIQSLEKYDVRVKIKNSTENKSQNFVLFTDQLSPNNTRQYFRRTNKKTTNQISAGITKPFKRKSIMCYAGADFNIGVVEVEQSLTVDYIDAAQLMIKSVGGFESTNYFFGLTPLLGSRIKLSSRLAIDLEFGFSMQYNSGRTATFDDSGILQERPSSFISMEMDRWLNDARICFLF